MANHIDMLITLCETAKNFNLENFDGQLSIKITWRNYSDDDGTYTFLPDVEIAINKNKN